MNVPDGFILHDVAKEHNDLPEGQTAFRREKNGEVILDIPGPFYIPIPVDREVQEDFYAGYSTTFRTLEGGIKLQGAQAALARKSTHNFESFVGTLKDEAGNGVVHDPDELQLRVIAAGVSGWSTDTTKTVSKSEIENLDPDELAQYLARKGIAVSD